MFFILLLFFSGGLLAVIALIINYQAAIRSIFTIFLEIQWYLFWNIILPFFFLFFTGENTDLFVVVATTFCLSVIGLSWIWIVYRAIRGIMRLNDNQPMYQ